MKRICTLFVTLLCLTANAGAATALLGEVFHDYGSAAGKIDPAGTDVLSGDFVTVSDSSGTRFSDTFNFSGLSYASVSYYELTLSFAKTSDSFESWRARPGQSTSLPALTRVGDILTTQTFTFGPTTDTFASSVNAQTFNLWFSEEGLGAHNFQLYDARLAVFGVALSVPEPPNYAMLSAGLIILAAITRRRI